MDQQKPRNRLFLYDKYYLIDNMKTLKNYINESINKEIYLDSINDEELKKFAKDVTIKVNAKYHLDYGFDEDFVFNAISKLKNKKLKVSVNDFDMYEGDNG